MKRVVFKPWRIWLLWIIATLYVPYQFLLQAAPSVMIPELMSSFNITAVDIGVLSSSFFYSYTILQVPSGILIDRFGARRILTVTIASCAGACLLFATARTFFAAECSRFLMGIAASTSVVAALYLASNWFSMERFGLLAGIMEMMGMLGGAVGQASLAKCVTCFGWRETTIICAAVGFLLTILVWFLVQDHPLPQQDHQQKQNRQPAPLNRLNVIFQNKQLWINGFYCGLIFAMMSGFAGLWSVPYLMMRFKLPLTSAAYYTSIIFIGAALGGPLLGWFAGKLKRYRLIMALSAFVALLVYAVLIYLSNLSLWLLALLLFTLGFACGSYTLSFMVTRENTEPEARGAAMGFTNMMCILIGAPIIQPLVGYLLAQHNRSLAITSYNIIDYQYALSSLVICLGLAFICALCLKEVTEH